ncbi:MAG: lytic transglycosylase domain-containing protein [Janthinobacterium lividum]
MHFGRTVRPALALALCACLPVAHALERIHLRNGFSYDCARQEPLDAAHVRLYLANTVPADSANYIDLPADAIVSVETVPDPPKSSAAALGSAASADIRSLLAHAGTVHDIDVELLASIVHAESGGRAAAISRAGAIGLMQLMPATAQAMGVGNALLPEDNIAGGTAYLDALLKRYHESLPFALAAYNAGPAAVDRYHGVPPFPETRAYVARVMSEFKRRKLALERTARASR